MCFGCYFSFVAFLLVSAVAACAPSAAGPPYLTDTVAVLEGSARIVDGDTLDIGGARVRMKGIAAPERGEAGGPEAAAALSRFVGDQSVRCLLAGERTHDRVVGYCFAAELDLGRALVAGGFALACPRFSDRYVTDEAAPRRALIGVWARGYTLPAYCGAP